jgi:ribosomal protein L37AE/L43A
MSEVSHFYVCPNCDKRHKELAAVIACCLFIKEVWQCRRCGKDFARSPDARACYRSHRRTYAIPKIAVAEIGTAHFQ